LAPHALGITMAGERILASKDVKVKRDTITVEWKSESATSDLCQIICVVSLLSVIAQFLVGVLHIFSGDGINWVGIGFTLAAAIASTLLARDLSTKRIVMSKQNMAFSLGFGFDLFFKLHRKWTDVGAVALQEADLESLPSDDAEMRDMVFHFASGGSTRIPLRALTVQDLDAIFRASKRWGSTAVMAPELIELRRKLVAGPATETLKLSLTTLWEKELQSNFTTSTFVPLATGTTLFQNRLRVIAQIGAGGMSAIYLARNNENKKVILKELVLHKSSEDGLKKAKELFTRESGLLVKLKHPQIARVFDHFVEKDRDYLVLEYIPGQTLRQLVEREGPRMEDKVLDWANAIAGILLYLHAQEPPIIHRDITPENLVFGEDNLIHLIDFGAANEFAATATGTLIGKQAYIAPEQFRGKPEPASDIYSLGATMYYLLTGEDPEALSSSNPCDKNKSVSVQTGNFVARLTSIDPNDRPRDCLSVTQHIANLRATERGAEIPIGKN
jgi:tRNA A-37 threonylcarbamoyl transferase component Bud32